MYRFFCLSMLFMLVATSWAGARMLSATDTLLTTPDNDTLILSKEDYNTIVTRYPKLMHAEFPVHPDLLYAGRDSEDLLFESDAGRDFYCMVYAFFLKQRNGVTRYAAPRKALNNIFQNLNTLFARLRCGGGGTYYAHREARVPAFAEYGVYGYALCETEPGCSKTYNIAVQKQHYIALLQQIINDEMETDDDAMDCAADRKQELLSLLNEIDLLITTPFYLEQALAFQCVMYYDW